MQYHTHTFPTASKAEAEAGIRDDVALSPKSLFGALLPITMPSVDADGASITISDSPPSEVADGDMWWESDSGNLWLWYVDDDAGQWVQVSGGGGDDLHTTPVAAIGSSIEQTMPEWLAGAPVLETGTATLFVTADYRGAWVHCTNATGTAIYLPADWLPGWFFGVRQIGTGPVTWVATYAATTQAPASKATHTAILEQYEEVVFRVITNSDGLHAVWGFSGATAPAGVSVNVPPSATNLSTAESYVPDTPLNLIDIVVTDPDSANVTVILTLSNPSAGSLSTGTSGSVTSTYASGVWTASGPLANVNALLAGVIFTPTASFSSNFTIATSVSDGAAAITGTKAFTSIVADTPPSATNLSAAESYTEDTPLNLTNIVVTDADSPNITARLTLSNTAAGSLSTATSGSVTSTYNAGTGVWTAAGPIANVNVLLAGVMFTPAANFNSNFSIATSISDGVAAAITGTKAMTGIAVADAPTATNLSAAETYTEDTPLNLTDIVISDVDSPTVTATLTLSNPGAGSLNTATSGAVTSTYNAGTGVWTASGATANVNTLLAGVTFTPTADFNSNFTMATSVSDGTTTITGSKAFTGIPVAETTGTIPLSYGDARFASNTTSFSVTVSSGTVLQKSITDTGDTASIVAFGSVIVDTCRISSREAVRAGGNVLDIRNSYLEATGEADDHADTIQAYSPGTRGASIIVTDTSVVAHTTAATAGLFVADDWGGTVTCNNVVFNGGPFGVRIHADPGCTVNIYMKDCFFVGPYGFSAIYISPVGTGIINITHWENVRNATIVGGVLVPGSAISAPSF